MLQQVTEVMRHPSLSCLRLLTFSVLLLTLLVPPANTRFLRAVVRQLDTSAASPTPTVSLTSFSDEILSTASVSFALKPSPSSALDPLGSSIGSEEPAASKSPSISIPSATPTEAFDGGPGGRSSPSSLGGGKSAKPSETKLSSGKVSVSPLREPSPPPAKVTPSELKPSGSPSHAGGQSQVPSQSVSPSGHSSPRLPTKPSRKPAQSTPSVVASQTKTVIPSSSSSLKPVLNAEPSPSYLPRTAEPSGLSSAHRGRSITASPTPLPSAKRRQPSSNPSESARMGGPSPSPSPLAKKPNELLMSSAPDAKKPLGPSSNPATTSNSDEVSVSSPSSTDGSNVPSPSSSSVVKNSRQPILSPSQSIEIPKKSTEPSSSAEHVEDPTPVPSKSLVPKQQPSVFVASSLESPESSSVSSGSSEIPDAPSSSLSASLNGSVVPELETPVVSSPIPSASQAPENSERPKPSWIGGRTPPSTVSKSPSAEFASATESPSASEHRPFSSHERPPPIVIAPTDSERTSSPMVSPSPSANQSVPSTQSPLTTPGPETGFPLVSPEPSANAHSALVSSSHSPEAEGSISPGGGRMPEASSSPSASSSANPTIDRSVVPTIEPPSPQLSTPAEPHVSTSTTVEPVLSSSKSPSPGYIGSSERITPVAEESPSASSMASPSAASSPLPGNQSPEASTSVNIDSSPSQSQLLAAQSVSADMLDPADLRPSLENEAPPVQESPIGNAGTSTASSSLMPAAGKSVDPTLSLSVSPSPTGTSSMVSPNIEPVPSLGMSPSPVSKVRPSSTNQHQSVDPTMPLESNVSPENGAFFPNESSFAHGASSPNESPTSIEETHKIESVSPSKEPSSSVIDPSPTEDEKPFSVGSPSMGAEMSIEPVSSPETAKPSVTDTSQAGSSLPDGSPSSTEGAPSAQNTPVSSVMPSLIPTPLAPVPSISALVSPTDTYNASPQKEAPSPLESVLMSPTPAFEVDTSAEAQASTASPSSTVRTPAAEESHLDEISPLPDETPPQIVGSESAGMKPSVSASPSATIKALQSPEEVPSLSVDSSLSSPATEETSMHTASSSTDMVPSLVRSQRPEQIASSTPLPSRAVSPMLDPALSAEVSPSIGLSRPPERSVAQLIPSLLVSPSSHSSLALEPSNSSSDMQTVERSESPDVLPLKESTASLSVTPDKPSSMGATPESSQTNVMFNSQSLEAATSPSTGLSPDTIDPLHSDASPETSMEHVALQSASFSAVPDASQSFGLVASVLPSPSLAASPRISSSPSRRTFAPEKSAIASPDFTSTATGEFDDGSPMPQRDQSMISESPATTIEFSKSPATSETIYPESSLILPEPTVTPSIPPGTFPNTPAASSSSTWSSEPTESSVPTMSDPSDPANAPTLSTEESNSPFTSGSSFDSPEATVFPSPPQIFFSASGSPTPIQILSSPGVDSSMEPSPSAAGALDNKLPESPAVYPSNLSGGEESPVLPASPSLLAKNTPTASASINVEANPSHIGKSATPSIHHALSSTPSKSIEMESLEPSIHESTPIPVSDMNPRASESALASSSVTPSMTSSVITDPGAESSSSSPSVSGIHSSGSTSLNPSYKEDPIPSSAHVTPTTSVSRNGVIASPTISNILPSSSGQTSSSPAVSGSLFSPSPSSAENSIGSSNEEILMSPVHGTPTASAESTNESLLPSLSKSSPSPSRRLSPDSTIGPEDPSYTSPFESPDKITETDSSHSPLPATPTASGNVGIETASPSISRALRSPTPEPTSDFSGDPGSITDASPTSDGIPSNSAKAGLSPSLTFITPMTSANIGGPSAPASASGISPSPTLRPTSNIPDVSGSGTDASPTFEENPSSSWEEPPLAPSLFNLSPSPNLAEGVISPVASTTPLSLPPKLSDESSSESVEPLYSLPSDGEELFSSPLLKSPSAPATPIEETVSPSESEVVPSPLPEPVVESPTELVEPVHLVPSAEENPNDFNEESSPSPQYGTPTISGSVDVDNTPTWNDFRPSPLAESASESPTESVKPFYPLSSDESDEVDSNEDGLYPSPQFGAPTLVSGEEIAPSPVSDFSSFPWEGPTLEPVLESMAPLEPLPSSDASSGLGGEEVVTTSSGIPEISPHTPDESLLPSVDVGTSPHPSSLVEVSDEPGIPEQSMSTSDEIPDGSSGAEVPLSSMLESPGTLPNTETNPSPLGNGITMTPDEDQDSLESAEPSSSSVSGPGLTVTPTLPDTTPPSPSVSLTTSSEFSPEPSLAVTNGPYDDPSESLLPSPIDATISPSFSKPYDLSGEDPNSLVPSAVSGSDIFNAEPSTPSVLASVTSEFGFSGPSYSTSVSPTLSTSASPSGSPGVILSSPISGSTVSGKGTPSPGVDPLANAGAASGNGGGTGAPSGDGLPGGAGGVSGIAIGSLFVILVVGSVLYKTCAVFPEGSGFTIGSIFGSADEGDGKEGWMAGGGSELDDSPWDQVWRSASELPENVVAAGEAAAALVGGEFAGLLKPGAARVRPPQVITRLAVPGMCMALSQLSPGSSDVFSTMSGHSSESRSFRSSRFPSSQQNFNSSANAANEESVHQGTAECIAPRVDLLFVFDASGSLSWREYRTMKEILTRPGGLIDSVMGRAHSGSRVGFIEYAYDSVVVSELDKDEEAVRRRILSSFQGDANNWDKDGMYIYEVGEEVGGNALRKVDSLVERGEENMGQRNESVIASEGDIEEPPIVQAKEVPPAMNGMSREAHLALKWSRFEMLPPVANRRIQEQLQNALRLRRIVVINAGELTKGGQSENGVEAAMGEKREIENAGIRIMTLGIGEERAKDLNKLATGKYHLSASSVEGVMELIPRLTEMILKMDARHDRNLSRNALAIIKRKRRKRDRSAREKRQQAVYRAMQAGAIDPVKSISKGLPRRASELPPWFTQ